MKSILIVGLLFVGATLQSQKIQKKGELGVQVAIAKSNDYEALYAVQQVVPHSTAEKCQVRPHDILIEIDGIPQTANDSIMKAIDGFVVGDQAQLKVLRNDTIVELRGEIMAREPIKKVEHSMSELEVPFKEGFMRAYLTYPKGDGPFPTIYFIQGYACQTINDHIMSPTLQLTNSLVDKGYAVFRMEKPGVGEYSNLMPCMNYDFDDEVQSFQNGLILLKEQQQVDSKEISLFGHSLGGAVAPILAQQTDVAGVITYGTLVKPWEDYLVDMALYSQTYEEDIDAVFQKLPILKSAISKLYSDQSSHNSLNSEERQLLKEWHGYHEDVILNRSVEFWQKFSKRNLWNVWLDVKTPVLAMHGEFDVHAISPLDAQLIVHALNSKKEGQATFNLIQGSNHAMAKVESREKEHQILRSGMAGQLAMTMFNSEIPKAIDKWIKHIAPTERSSKKVSNNHMFVESGASFPKMKTSKSSMDVEVADFNNDGVLDIVVATEFGPNLLFLRKGDEWIEKSLPQLRNYSPPLLGEDSEDIGVADFNKDGFLDLIFVSEDTDHHELLFNDGNGNFQYPTFQIEKDGQANAVLIHDFNEDGWEDVLLGIRGENELYLNLNGKGFKRDFSDLWPKNSDHTQDLVLVDVDDDGDFDIVEGAESGGSNLYKNESSKYILDEEALGMGENFETRKVIAQDFDQDGDSDLFFCNVGWNPAMYAKNQLLLNEGDGKFSNVSHWISEDMSTTLDAVFLDINRDGLIDFMTTNFVNDKKTKVFIAQKDNDTLEFKEQDGWLPPMTYTGGVALKMFEDGNDTFLYFGNFNSPDILLKAK